MGPQSGSAKLGAQIRSKDSTTDRKIQRRINQLPAPNPMATGATGIKARFMRGVLEQ